MTVAMERGEVEGVTNSWDSWKSFNPAWVEEKKIKVLVQTEPKSKELVGVPSVQELARNENDRRIIQLIVSGDALGKPVATSPNVPIERVQALREAFDATVKDRALSRPRQPRGPRSIRFTAWRSKPPWKECLPRRRTWPNAPR